MMIGFKLSLSIMFYPQGDKYLSDIYQGYFKPLKGLILSLKIQGMLIHGMFDYSRKMWP